MKIFNFNEYVNMKNPTPGQAYRPAIVTSEDGAKDLYVRFCLNEPGSETRYHYHKENEVVRVVISGEGTHITVTPSGEKKENVIKAGDVLHIPKGEVHRLVNKNVRFLEFFTHPPIVTTHVEDK